MKKYYHSPSNVGIIDAAQRGDVNAVKAILQVNPECMTMCDERGYTAFHWAAYSDDIEVFSLLVAVNEIALWNLKTLKGQNALHIACSNGSQRVVNRILEVVSNITDHIDEVNQHGETPLHLAAAANYTELVERLLNCGANATLKDQWGRTAQKVKYVPLFNRS